MKYSILIFFSATLVNVSSASAGEMPTSAQVKTIFEGYCKAFQKKSFTPFASIASKKFIDMGGGEKVWKKRFSEVSSGMICELKLKSIEEVNGRPTILAELTEGDKTHPKSSSDVSFAVVKEGGTWRIDDMIMSDGD